MSNKLYKCSMCGKKKQGFEFGVRSNGKPKSWCKLCTRKAAKEGALRRKDEIAAYQKEHKKANRDTYAAREGLRRASKLQRTPKWLTDTDISKIKSIYKIARALSKKTGNPHHVDHVIPLQGKLVSGLHCPTNLQVIPASENLSKSNKYSV